MSAPQFGELWEHEEGYNCIILRDRPHSITCEYICKRGNCYFTFYSYYCDFVKFIRKTTDLTALKNKDEMKMGIRAGDTVKHLPTGEDWVAAVDVEKDGDVYYMGYPFGGCANVAHCRLVQAATDEERLNILINVSKSNNRSLSDKAKRQIKETET